MKEYLESKQKKADKKTQLTNLSIQSTELKQQLSKDMSISSQTSNETTKFYKKIIEAEQFELELHAKKNSKFEDDLKIEEPSSSDDDDDLDRQ